MKYTNSLVNLLLLAVFCGCSSLNNKNLDQKISHETHVTTREELRTETKDSIENSVNLTADQKKQLTELRLSITNQTNEMNKKSLELRSVLLKDILSTNYNHKEVGLIKNRMKKLEEKRLTMIFDALDKANVIMGRQASENHLLMQELLRERNLSE